MALSQQDLLRGLDFTGVNPITGADLNNGIDLAAPVLDTASEGKSLNLWTIDSALNTPIVPNATVVTKWKRYIWLRILHATATSHIPVFYAWDDSASSDPTYLKWQRIEMDTAALEAAIAALEVLVDGAVNTANNASTVAGAANTNAAAALTAANAALATANTAAVNAESALSQAQDAQAAANTAQTTANAAQVAANNATAVAANALANSATVAANKFFTSADFILAVGILADTAHNLGATPKDVRWVLVCQAGGDIGYAEGDEIPIAMVEESGNNHQNFGWGANATNVFLVVNSITTMIAPAKTALGTPTIMANAKWKARCYAWLGGA